MRSLWVFFVLISIFVRRVISECNHHTENCWSSESHFPQVAATDPCFTDEQGTLCKCSNTTANCSLTHGILQFVPDLGRSYQVLNFSYNNVSAISRDFFTNASKAVRVIDLYNNGIRSIATDAFAALTELTTLLLGGSNILGYHDVRSLILSLPTLLNVSFSCVWLKQLPVDVFRGTNESRLVFLDLSWNSIGSLNLSAFQPLTQLREVSLWRNNVYDLETAYLPSWEVVSLATNRLFQFPKTCSESGDSLFPNLTVLNLEYNMIACIDDPVCLPNVKYLRLNFNKFLYLTSDMVSGVRFPSLRELDIMQMEDKILKVSPFFINNSAVEMVNFELSQVDFATVHVHAFSGCNNINVLILTGNSFQGVSDDQFQCLLDPVRRSLQILMLGKAQIRQISSRTFRRFPNLTELHLFGNLLAWMPDGAFDELPSLRKLVLDNNNIPVISKSTFSPQLLSRLRVIDLSGNPFQCDCDILSFQRWMMANTGKMRDHHHVGYQCNNVNNVSLADFVLNDQACILGSDAAALTISIACFLIFFLILFIVFFRFRWHVRLWLYEVCRGRSQRRRRCRQRFRYDVFVSYAEENREWVHHELIPKAEEEWGLRLCVHQRDFVPGKHIVDNICDCVADSERVLLVFSPYFARSEWCQFELKYCQVCVMEREDVLVLVALQGVPSRDMTGTMLALMKTTTYIEWGEQQDARESFWGRLKLALEEPEEIVIERGV